MVRERENDCLFVFKGRVGKGTKNSDFATSPSITLPSPLCWPFDVLFYQLHLLNMNFLASNRALNSARWDLALPKPEKALLFNIQNLWREVTAQTLSSCLLLCFFCTINTNSINMSQTQLLAQLCVCVLLHPIGYTESGSICHLNPHLKGIIGISCDARPGHFRWTGQL